MQFAVQRELGSRGTALKGRHHRIPIGLLMLEKGWIAHKDLAAALRLQRESGMGRLGEWLIKLGRSDEATITRALGLQWSCPVLSVDTRCPDAPLSSIMPRLFLDAFGALPIRFHAGRIAYLGFERSLDPVLAFAVERMMGLRVECGVVQTSQFMMAQAQLLRATFPRLQLAEAASGSAAAHLIARTLERSQPAASRLVRVHDFLWLRMSLSSESFLLAPDHNVQDLVCTIGAF